MPGRHYQVLEELVFSRGNNPYELQKLSYLLSLFLKEPIADDFESLHRFFLLFEQYCRNNLAHDKECLFYACYFSAVTRALEAAKAKSDFVAIAYLHSLQKSCYEKISTSLAIMKEKKDNKAIADIILLRLARILSSSTQMKLYGKKELQAAFAADITLTIIGSIAFVGLIVMAATEDSKGGSEIAISATLRNKIHETSALLPYVDPTELPTERVQEFINVAADLLRNPPILGVYRVEPEKYQTIIFSLIHGLSKSDQMALLTRLRSPITEGEVSVDANFLNALEREIAPFAYVAAKASLKSPLDINYPSDYLLVKTSLMTTPIDTLFSSVLFRSSGHSDIYLRPPDAPFCREQLVCDLVLARSEPELHRAFLQDFLSAGTPWEVISRYFNHFSHVQVAFSFCQFDDGYAQKCALLLKALKQALRNTNDGQTGASWSEQVLTAYLRNAATHHLYVPEAPTETEKLTLLLKFNGKVTVLFQLLYLLSELQQLRMPKDLLQILLEKCHDSDEKVRMFAVQILLSQLPYCEVELIPQIIAVVTETVVRTTSCQLTSEVLSILSRHCREHTLVVNDETATPATALDPVLKHFPSYRLAALFLRSLKQSDLSSVIQTLLPLFLKVSANDTSFILIKALAPYITSAYLHTIVQLVKRYLLDKQNYAIESLFENCSPELQTNFRIAMITQRDGQVYTSPPEPLQAMYLQLAMNNTEFQIDFVFRLNDHYGKSHDLKTLHSVVITYLEHLIANGMKTEKLEAVLDSLKQFEDSLTYLNDSKNSRKILPSKYWQTLIRFVTEKIAASKEMKADTLAVADTNAATSTSSSSSSSSSEQSRQPTTVNSKNTKGKIN